MCLVYFAWRFSPRCPPAPGAAVAVADAVAAGGLLLGIALFCGAALRRLPPVTALPLLGGCGALALLAGYPVQLALLGDEWWQCVQRQFPQQGVGMAGYIYVSASFSFGAILFGATLMNRRVVTEGAFAAAFASLVLATLLCTVLSQEVWIPRVSTQMLYIPCPAPDPDGWEAWAATTFNTSALAQACLAHFGLDLKAPPHQK